jgi:hypothetical protein
VTDTLNVSVGPACVGANQLVPLRLVCDQQAISELITEAVSNWASEPSQL